MTERNAVDEGMELADATAQLYGETWGSGGAGPVDNLRNEAREALRAHLQAMQDRLTALERVAKESARYLPVLERLEDSPLWHDLTIGTGIATVNGLRSALALLEPKGKEKQG